MYAELADLVVRTGKDREKSCLLRAHLAALLEGVVLGHVDDDSFQTLSERFADVLTDRGYLDAPGVATGKPLRAEQVWNCFAKAVDDVAPQTNGRSGEPHALSDTRDPVADYGGMEFACLSQLEYHDEAARSGANLLDLDDYLKLNGPKIARFGKDRGRLADIVLCIGTAVNYDVAIAGRYLKGAAGRIAWLTPRTGHVSALLDRLDGQGVLPSALDELRDLLGLWNENGKGSRPLGAFCFRDVASLKAPNVITASGYPRFRHRPTYALADGPNAGLTFNLDPSAPSDLSGSCEVVAAGVAMGQMTELRMCGQPSPFGLDRAAELAAHERYAEDASGGRSWTDIMGQLDLAA